MLLRFWRPGSRVMFCVLILTALIALAACQQSGPANTAQTSSPGSAPSSSSARNHVPAGTRPQFVRVTFTAATTYDQARALLTSVGQIPYPWACSDLYFGYAVTCRRAVQRSARHHASAFRRAGYARGLCRVASISGSLPN